MKVRMNDESQLKRFLLYYYLLVFIQSTDGLMTSIINFEYFTSSSNYTRKIEENRTDGIVASRSSRFNISRQNSFILTDLNGNFDGCQTPTNQIVLLNSVAIIQRGGNCTFSVKVTRAKQLGASAVIIYDPNESGRAEPIRMSHNTTDIYSLYVGRSVGSFLFSLARDSRTMLNVSLKPIYIDYPEYSYDTLWFGSQSATIFIAVSILILILLCISWLIFYMCQRHRARTAKDRLQNRLSNAAKKALTKIQLVNVNENPTNDDTCVICLDAIQHGDTVRQLVCGHRFHQHCVDPWLLNHRHCPLCNLDILAAYRVSVSSSQRRQRRRSTADQNRIVASSSVPSASSQTTNQPPTFDRQPLPTISATIKDQNQSNGQQNPTFQSDDQIV